LAQNPRSRRAKSRAPPVSVVAKTVAEPGIVPSTRYNGPVFPHNLSDYHHLLAVWIPQIVIRPADVSNKPHSSARLRAVWSLSGVRTGATPRVTPGASVQPTSSRTTLSRKIVLPLDRASARPRPIYQ